MAIAGDFVIRLEDVEYSIRKMRSRVNIYRPDYQGQGRSRSHGRGNYGSGRGGRGSRGGGLRGHQGWGIFVI